MSVGAPTRRRKNSNLNFFKKIFSHLHLGLLQEKKTRAKINLFNPFTEADDERVFQHFQNLNFFFLNCKQKWQKNRSEKRESSVEKFDTHEESDEDSDVDENESLLAIKERLLDPTQSSEIAHALGSQKDVDSVSREE